MSEENKSAEPVNTRPQPFPPNEFAARLQANNWTEADIPRILATIHMLGAQCSQLNQIALEGITIKRLFGAMLKEKFAPVRLDKRVIDALPEKFSLAIQETATQVIVELRQPAPTIIRPDFSRFTEQ